MKTKFLLYPQKEAPLVHLDIALLNGSLRDADGKEGTASLTLSMLLRGTKQRSAKEFHEKLDALGAEISLGKYKESMRLHAVVLAEKIEPLMDLLEEVLVEPLFDEKEFEKLRGQFRSSFLDELGSDDDIADRRFQEYLLWGSAYGKMTSGGLDTIDRIDLSDLKQFHAKYFRPDDLVVGALGGFNKKWLTDRVKKILKRLPSGGEGRLEVEAPKFPKGRSILLLNKPERTQAQVIIGAQGVSFKDKNYLPLLIANHVFGGGSFSARLMKEVREKRGWSYGAYGYFKAGRQPLYFAMQTVPTNKDAVAALALMTKLYIDFSNKGISKEEFTFAKTSLVNQSAFLQDTPRKRLDNKVTEAVLGLPDGFYDGYRKRLLGITYAKVQAAIRSGTNSSNLFAVMLGSVVELKPHLSSAKGYKKIWERPFDQAGVNVQKLTPLILKAGRSISKEDSKTKKVSRR